MELILTILLLRETWPRATFKRIGHSHLSYPHSFAATMIYVNHCVCVCRGYSTHIGGLWLWVTYRAACEQSIYLNSFYWFKITYAVFPNYHIILHFIHSSWCLTTQLSKTKLYYTIKNLTKTFRFIPLYQYLYRYWSKIAELIAYILPEKYGISGKHKERNTLIWDLELQRMNGYTDPAWLSLTNERKFVY